ncbi:MAG TPA: GNAT family N-acetyltransferase [Myxococcaceae bacterium]|nr:GNAT family N-acetyltransferase [Myxococcaceae bacterium]
MSAQVAEPIVREAGAVDLPELIRLRLALLSTFGPVDHPDALAEATAGYLERAMSDGSFLAVVAEVDGRLVASSGLCVLRRLPLADNPGGLEGYILNMYTEPTWRRRGLARDILRQLLALGKQRGLARVWLHATADGRALYEAEGFTGNPTALERRL